MRWGEHLRAQPPKKQVQAMWRIEHMRAQPSKAHVQGLRRGGHLRAQPQKEQVQGLQAEGGLVLAIRTEERWLCAGATWCGGVTTVDYV